MVWSEGKASLKNPVMPPGIDPGTVQLVAQHFNHYANPVRNIIIITSTTKVYLSDSFVEGKSVYFFKTLSVTNNGKLFVHVLTSLKNCYTG